MCSKTGIERPPGQIPQESPDLLSKDGRGERRCDGCCLINIGSGRQTLENTVGERSPVSSDQNIFLSDLCGRKPALIAARHPRFKMFNTRKTPIPHLKRSFKGGENTGGSVSEHTESLHQLRSNLSRGPTAGEEKIPVKYLKLMSLCQ